MDLVAIKQYLLVAKPGIVGGNLMAALAGFFLASRGHPDIAALLPMATGIGLVVASACVLNNWIDRNLDAAMSRTRHRALASGRISARTALLYACALGAGGVMLLAAASNALCMGIALAGFAVYVGIYSLRLKRTSPHAPLVGSLAGAAPPVAGYCAASGCLDGGAAILLLIFILWQVPHFNAIAILHLDDYASAGIPVLPVKQGAAAAKRQSVRWIAALAGAAAMLTVCEYTGYIYLAAALASSLAWLLVAWQACRATDDLLWAKRSFLCSILTISVLSVTMATDSAVPM